MPSPPRILIVEDEAPIRRFLEACMTADEATWLEATTAEEAIKGVARSAPDLVLLDLGLPDRDGLDVLAEIRTWSQVPVIVLTARGMERDKVAALDAGADDYVTKPFSVPELMARIRVALRRGTQQTATEPTFEAGGLRLDFVARTVTVDGQEVRLTPIEYRLLALLARHAGRVLTHRQMLVEVWGPAYADATHTLRVHMASIRQKVERDATHPTFIRTETGVGYRLIAQDSA